MKHHALTAPLMTLGRQGVKRAMNATCLLALAIGTALIVATPAMAQATSAETATRDFDIRAGALGSALLRFAEQSGLQFSVTSEMTAGKRTAGIKGKYTPEDGLRALLSGTGLTFRFTGPRTVVIEPAPETGDARVLGPLRIEGAAGRAGTGGNGVNGSTDGTATENSGTYAATSTSMVSKATQSVLDTPQTVSVLSRKQLQEQNVNDFSQAMLQAPGITVRNGGDNLSSEFISRGYYVSKFRVDGGSPMSTDYFFRPTFDMAMYDHVEILRGADGLYSGYGNPGGVVNLVRKRPLDHNQVLVEIQAGSWNFARTTLDVTGPMVESGRVRARGVFTYQDRDFYYDTAYEKHLLAYAMLEGDVTDSLVVRGGASLTDQNALPWEAGLPRYEDGRDLGLSRNTCLCYDDATLNTRSIETFLQAEYQFSPDWLLDVNLTRIDQQNDKFQFEPFGGVNPTTGRGFGGPYTGWNDYRRNSIKNAFDASLKGHFTLFGLDQFVTVGANYTDGYALSYKDVASPYGSMVYQGKVPGMPAGDLSYYYGVDVLHFSSSDIRYRPGVRQADGYWDEGSTESTAYMNWNAYLTEKLQLNVGLRYSTYETHNQSVGYCIPWQGTTCDLYAQDENGNWVVVGTLNPGEAYPASRYQVTNKDNTFSWPPTWSLVYKMSDTWSLYGSYADSYQSNGSMVTPEHKPLPPETGFNAEFGSNYLSADGLLSAKAALYYGVKDGFAVLLYDDFEYNDSMFGDRRCCFAGGDDTRNINYGLDLEVNGEVLPGWQVSASYNYNNNYMENRIVGSRSLPWSFAPKHMMKVWTTYQFQNGPEWLTKLNVGGGVNMQTRTYDRGQICTEYEYGFDPISGQPTSTCLAMGDYAFGQGFYSIYTARADYQLSDRWNLSLNINNLFDKKYYTKTSPPYYGNWYGDPRNVMLTLRGQF